MATYPTTRRIDMVSDRHNQRRRKNTREAVKTAAFGTYNQQTKSWSKPVRPRCDARDKDGHRCHHDPHSKGNHSAFGREWR